MLARITILSLVCLALGSAQDQPKLFRKPAVSKNLIVFSYADDLWSVPREGGTATRLTAAPGFETDPVFSPDGTQIAFTGQYDGNVDVFVMPATGGVPRRLTYHPAPDRAIGWTPDGMHILFSSSRASFSFFNRLFTVSQGGGSPTEIPLVRAEEGSYSPDASHIAYVPVVQWQAAWKRYHGGQTKPIWIANLADSSIETEIPRNNSNDFNPMWIGNTIYFLSDRNGPITLFSYDTQSKQVKELVHNTGLDIKSASAGPGVIIYEQFGSIHLYDLNSHQEHRVKIQLNADLLEVRPHFQKIEPGRIRFAAISPTGVRAALGARGEILTVPAEKGDIRNITETPGVVERDPAWSPDGKSIAYFSDESGEYALHIKDQSGTGAVRKIDLGNPPSFFYSPKWSPDSKKIAYTDKRLNLWYVDLDTSKLTKIDTDTFAGPNNQFNPDWSPDSKWIAYTRQLRNYLHAVFAYSLDHSKSTQITDGMSDAMYAAFDKEGKYLYLTASTNSGLTMGWLDMSSLAHPVTRSVYAIVLKKGVPSPLAPESDEEKVAAKEKDVDKDKSADKDKSKDAKPADVTIDFDGIGQRIVTLPIPARNYTGLAAGKPGVIFLLESAPVDDASGNGEDGFTLHKFEMKTRKTDKLLEDLSSFDLAFNGEKMLYRQKDQWVIAPAAKPTGAPPNPGEGGPLKLGDLQIYVDPRAEWTHMYHQIWRDERDFFYDPGLHGVDPAAIQKKYASYLENISTRRDLNYLFEEMLGEMTVGHMFVGGGDQPEIKRVAGGLLGADYKIENGRYRFARVYNGENWNPKLRAPLTQPGVDVQAGEYLISVRGHDVRDTDDIYRFFEETAGKSVIIRVGPNPDGSASREVTVVPVADEGGLRNLAWIEDNRRKVDQLTNGRVAYVYMPNTYTGGYTNFNRYFFSQIGKDAVIIDERFNGGGQIADYVIDYLRRPLLSYWDMREGTDITTPIEAIFGPKVMITNEMAGSGGDAMPWLFRTSGIGPLVGKRTWGGLVGHYTNAGDLLDDGFVGSPNLAFYTPQGTWEIENHGVSPDYEVELDPKLWRQGHDAQLEKAVAVIMEQLAKNPVKPHHRPPMPNYHKSEK